MDPIFHMVGDLLAESSCCTYDCLSFHVLIARKFSAMNCADGFET
jgi:hypothetical protein